MLTLDYILGRIEAKKADYRSYDFTAQENDAFKTFFDLAQEFDAMQDLYKLCVAIPRAFFNFEANLYLIDPAKKGYTLVASTRASGVPRTPPLVPEGPHVYSGDNALVLGIRGKHVFLNQLPFETEDDVLGLLEIYPATGLNPHLELFFEKYSNRIGFNLHNRLLVEKNIEHLRFIRSLVADIEHNIIAPNIVYKLYLKNLEAAVTRSIEVERSLVDLCARDVKDTDAVESVMSELSDVNRALQNELQAISRHHQNMSLFLEALLRRSHFDQGRLTLRTKRCNMKREVVEPQLERYAERFKNLGILVDNKLSGIPEEETVGVVDVGLMAQVYANLLSNALKYTQEITTHSGEKKKYVSYGYERIRDYFGTGIDGLKYNLFSTGQHIEPGERDRVFEDEFRGKNSRDKPGTGHGLAFIKNVVEIHGGVVGYEPTDYGNNFYFILPEKD